MLRQARGVAAALSSAGVSLHVLDRQSPTSAAASPIKTRDVGLGRRILISLPPSYDEQVSRRKTFNAVYVLDARLFSLVVDGIRADHAAVVGLKDRQWHPELIVVGLGGPIPRSPSSLLNFIRDEVLPVVDSEYSTNRYAAGRAIMAPRDTDGAAALRHLIVDESAHTSLFRFFLLGVDGSEAANATTTIAPLPARSAVFLSGEPNDALATSLRERTRGVSTETSMFVDRDGNQTYTEIEDALGPPVTIDADGQQKSALFAARAMEWLGERWERQKLHALGAMLPWHEFK